MKYAFFFLYSLTSAKKKNDFNQNVGIETKNV